MQYTVHYPSGHTFVLEGRLRRSCIKNGVIQDQVQYGYVVPEDAEITEDTDLTQRRRDAEKN